MFNSVLTVSLGLRVPSMGGCSRISQSWTDVIEVDCGLGKAQGEIELIDQSSIMLEVVADIHYLYCQRVQ